MSLKQEDTNQNKFEFITEKIDETQMKTDFKTKKSSSKLSTKKKKRKRGDVNELVRVQKRVNGFDANCSDAWTALCQQFGNKITHEELVSIAEAIKPYCNIKLDRDARRRKSVILKWYQDNWADIKQYIQYVSLEGNSSDSS